MSIRDVIRRKNRSKIFAPQRGSESVDRFRELVSQLPGVRWGPVPDTCSEHLDALWRLVVEAAAELR
jgi:hypothetical protein